MGLMKLEPAFKDYIWGGHRLVEEYGKKYDGDVLAESWELSCHPDGPSVIANGPYAGRTLREYIDLEGKQVLGENCARFEDFPILIKLIDAKQSLSVQVHPDNRYAREHEHQYGKTEMWVIADAAPDAFLYYGVRREISKEEFARRVRDNTLTEVLNKVPVQRGDVLFIESGTIHAIGENILVAEIQQNSNVTYRICDYGRIGKDGKPRELQLDKALDVSNLKPIARRKNFYPQLGDCDYFTVDRLNLDGERLSEAEGTVRNDSFLSILFLDGKGTISCGKEKLTFRKGESFLLTAGSGLYQVKGACDALVTSVRAGED